MSNWLLDNTFTIQLGAWHWVSGCSGEPKQKKQLSFDVINTRVFSLSSFAFPSIGHYYENV